MSVLGQSLPHLLRGAVSTLALAAAVLAVGTALGLAVGLLRVLPGRAGTVVGGAVELVRAVPLLLLLFFIFFGLPALGVRIRSEEHTSGLQSLTNLVCRLLLEKKKTTRQ